MNTDETAAILGMFAVAYPSATVQENTAKLWAEILAEVNPADGLAAAKALIRTSKFFPSIAEVLDAARSARRVRVGPSGMEPNHALEASEEDRRIPTSEEVRELVAETRRLLGRPRPDRPTGADVA